jgi:Ca2+-binding EF-hand superfamily protein
MVFQDISRLFPSLEEADAAFTLFDRDGNGDVSLEETEQSCAFVMLPFSCFIHF